MKRKRSYLNLIALLLCCGGVIKYFISYLIDKKTIDLIGFIIIFIILIVLIITLIIENIYYKKRNNKKLNTEETRVIKISKEALYEFIYEKFIENQNEYFDVNSIEVNNLFDIDYENDSFIFIVSDKDEMDFSKNIDFKRLLEKLPDTTTTMFKEDRYKVYTKEELIALSKKD